MTTSPLPPRAGFVIRERRYASAFDAAVKAAYPNSTEIIVESNLSSEADAVALASALHADTKVPAYGYEVEIEGLLSVNDFAGGVPRYILNAAEYNTDGRTLKLASVEIKPWENRTVLRLR